MKPLNTAPCRVVKIQIPILSTHHNKLLFPDTLEQHVVTFSLDIMSKASRINSFNVKLYGPEPDSLCPFRRN